jgi:hypothetical protein
MTEQEHKSHKYDLITITVNWMDEQLCERPEDAAFIIGAGMTRIAEDLGKETDYSALLKEHLNATHSKGLDRGIAIAAH